MHSMTQHNFLVKEIIHGLLQVKLRTNEKLSCYTYSNQNYPICTWLGRYKEITIEVIGRLKPGSVSLGELQTLVKIIDQKVSRQFED